MKVTPMFAWYDLWVGVFVDKPKRRVYVFPLPCLGVRIDLATDAESGRGLRENDG